MDSVQKIISQRSEPGVLILDLEGRLMYSNRQAQEIFSALQGEECRQDIPEEVYELCRRLKERGGDAVCGSLRAGDRGGGVDYALRAIMLGAHGGESADSHVMVLLEKVAHNRKIDFEKAREKFRLSKRETEVVKLLSQGLGNKEISGVIFVSEFTVKDHIKNILKKMGAASRNEIIALLL